jgi:hypothetical protein
MISLEATVRDNKTKGQLSAIRSSGNVPAIISYQALLLFHAMVKIKMFCPEK